jgi:hypothetical protein
MFMHLIIIENAKYSLSGAQLYDELVVQALVPKITGSNPAEAIGPMSSDLRHIKIPAIYVEVRIASQTDRLVQRDLVWHFICQFQTTSHTQAPNLSKKHRLAFE